MSWDADEEDLLCLVVLDDQHAARLPVAPGDAFFRAFIYRRRDNGHFGAKYRFNYATGRKSWFEMVPKPVADPQAALDKMKYALRHMLTIAAQMMYRITLPSEAVRFFEPPPEARVSSDATIAWLVAQDLIEIVGFEPLT